MSEFEIITGLTLIFVIAAALLLIASRYSLPIVPFYLIAGALVGVFVDEGELLDLAQWGIAFLVFAFAVHLEPFESHAVERDAALVAVVQAIVTGVLTYGLGLGLGFDPLNAVYFAIGATLSSSLVALSLLERRVRLRTLPERLAETIHFVEDLLAIAVVLLLSAFVYAGGNGTLQVATGVGMIVTALVIRRFVFPPLADFAEGDVEILMLTGVSLIIGFIAIAELTGVSIVVGAFAAGLAVASKYPHDVEMVDAIGYLEDFFTPVFFVTLGALAAVPTLETVGIAAVLIVAIVVLNPLVTYAILRWRDYDSRTATLTGFNLDQVSEFALIIAIEALVAQRLAPALFDAIIFAAVVTMLLSTVTHRYGADWYRRLAARGLLEPDLEEIRERSRVEDDLTGHVIVVSYDRDGQQVVDACESIGQPYVVLETDPTRRDVVRDHCERYVFGNAMAEPTWEVARASQAALIVASNPRSDWTKRILGIETIGDKILRAPDAETGAELLEGDVVYVSVPDVLAADQLCEYVQALLSGELTREELREQGRDQLDRAVKYGPDDVIQLR